MTINNKPNFVFINKENKKIYCWEDSNNVIFSLQRLDVKEGNGKRISKEDNYSLTESFIKLGLSKKDYSKIGNKRKLKEEVKNNPDFLELRNLREEQKKLIENKINPNMKSNINDLAYLAGTIGSNALYENNKAIEEKIETKRKEIKNLYDSNVKISKKELEEKFYNEDLVIKEGKEEKFYNEDLVIKEGKEDRIILGKTSVTQDASGLYRINIENIPGSKEFHADLYKTIQTYLNDKLEQLKSEDPDVKALEQMTINELSGKSTKQSTTAEEPIDIGLGAPEETAETAPEPTAPTTPGATTPSAGGATKEAVKGAVGV
jgi:hypothetical protein